MYMWIYMDVCMCLCLYLCIYSFEEILKFQRVLDFSGLDFSWLKYTET